MIQILHRDLVFAAMESVVRGIVERSAEIYVEVLDLTEVTELDLGAERLLVLLAGSMAEEGRALAIVAPSEEDLLDGPGAERLEVFPDLDRATEWCEDRLLDVHDLEPTPSPRVTLAEHRLARGLSPSQLSMLEEVLLPLRFEEGERTSPWGAHALLRDLFAGYYEIIGRKTRQVGSLLGGR